MLRLAASFWILVALPPACTGDATPARKPSPIAPEHPAAYKSDAERAETATPSSAKDAPKSLPATTTSPRSCRLADQDGFNHYTLAALQDDPGYPRDGSISYCWQVQKETCHGHWGMVHDADYAGGTLFDGGGDCYCSGHTLEIFLRAYRLWQRDHGVPASAPYEVDAYQLLAGDVDRYGEHGGVFYQFWQGFGLTAEASSAAALDAFGIGKGVAQADWDTARPGDYVNFSRANGTGHAVIFVAWVLDKKGARIGLRYYGCNRRGDACPDPNDPLNKRGVRGPSFVTERFKASGGQVLPTRLFIGRPSLPTTPH